MNIYQQELLDHFHSSTYRGTVENPSVVSAQYNPSCGDAVSLTASVDNGIITAIRFTGSGCVISQATASLLCEYVTGRSLEEIQAITTQQLIALIKVPLGPTRMKCALLSLYALQEGIKQLNAKEQNA